MIGSTWKKIVVASTNPAKLGAARRAFETRFPGQALDIVPAPAESGVGDQPFSDEDTRHGATGCAAARAMRNAAGVVRADG